jgi:cold shock CspA family protein
MYVPLEISFKGLPKSEKLDSLIRERVSKLERICDHISSCRVSVEKDQAHVDSGTPYRVRIDMRVPPSHELVSKKEPGQADMHADVETVIRSAFDGAENQLRKLVEKQRKEVKTHKTNEPIAIVRKIFKEEDYGFLQPVDDDREIYFHRNSVVQNDFDRMDVGTGVYFEAEMGEEGLQATTVRIVNKPGARPKDEYPEWQ